MDIPGFAGEAALGGLVTLALDRAIREIIQPVVERSVSIACITSQFSEERFCTDGRKQDEKCCTSDGSKSSW